jgi:general stress protein 26
MADKDSQMSTAEAIDTIWDLVKSIDFCMFVTWDGERQRARPLSARPRREEGKIYFLTDVTGQKDDQIERFPKVALAFADIRGHDYVAITGHATVSADREKIAELWEGLDRDFWDGPDDPAIRLIAVDPEDAELWAGPNRFAAVAKLVAGAMAGVKADFGENVKVDHL